MEEKVFGAFVIIPSSLLMDNNISAQAKLTFGVISNLSNQKGYCYATNAYISSLFNIHENTISKHIGELTDAGYLFRYDEILDDQKSQRRLVLSDPIKNELGQRNQGGGSTKTFRGGQRNQGGGVNENVDHNNISIIIKENIYTDEAKKIELLGTDTELFITIQPKVIGKTMYRIQGENGMHQLFDMHRSVIARPQFVRKFLLENLGKPYNDFMHIFNAYNQFVSKQYK